MLIDRSSSEDDLVLLHNSHWASNIGNPFFTLAANYLLDRLFEDAQVLCTSQVSSLAWNPTAAQREQSLQYVQYSDPDWFVMCGPMMSTDFVEEYTRVFENMPTDEMEIMLLSVGSSEYTQTEVERCREFLERFPPTVFFTRDSWTHDRYQDLAEHRYDGIDLAFFTPDFYPGYPTPRLEPYMTFTFDKAAEPDIEIDTSQERDRVRIGRVEHGRVRRNILRRLPREYPEELGGYRVIRPTHGVLNRSARSLYSKPNAFVSQTPYGYLNLYRNTTLTLADRVHACVPTLAYGSSARLFTDSGRARLFDRVGLGHITEEVCEIDSKALQSEKDDLVTELESIVEG